jgi:hypothetical protein
MTYASILTRLLPMLNADTVAELQWWTESELYAWMQEAAQRISRFALFVELASEPVTSGEPNYALPAQYRAAIQISLDERTLRPVSVAQLEARSTTWTQDSGTVENFVLDGRTVRIWRTPTSSGTLAILYYAWPSVAAGGSDRYPDVIGDAYAWHVIGDARAKPGDAMAPDIAAQARERARLYDAVIEQYWGTW